jgi:prephenate dehydrogenase
MIGLIGYGRFGRLTVQNLTPDCPVVVFTRNQDKGEDIAEAGGRLVSLEEACAQEIVILCVPISAMQPTLKQIAALVKTDALIVDVCSVKVYPVKWMQELLPETTQILATHPMFGPDSAAVSLAGHKIVLCPVRIQQQRYNEIKLWLQKKHLTIIETTPADHDEKIAVSLALTHFIGRSLAQFGALPLNIDTEGYKRLLHILGVTNNDTMQLFEDMHTYNPYAGDKRKAFMRAMETMNDHLNACKKLELS